MNAVARRGGFTLIELLVVIAIIGILSAVIITSLNSARQKAKIAGTVSQLREISQALYLWADTRDGSKYPLDTTVGTNPTLQTLISTYGLGDYLASAPKPSVGTGSYMYDNDGDTFTCGAAVTNGVNIYWGGVSAEDGAAINAIVDNDNDLNCGTVRMGGTTLYYSVSMGPML